MSETPNDPLITLPITTPNAVVEVYKSIDTLPPSPLADYMQAPATRWIDNGQGIQVPVEADHSRAVEVKAAIEQAAQDAAEGRIGVASLMGGMVNGKYDAETSGPNLHSAFRHLDGLFEGAPLRASTSFHSLFSGFRPSDAQSAIGYIYKGVEAGSTDEMQVVHAARWARHTGRPILHTDETGKPDGKLIPLSDPSTGSIAPNVFLQVRGSIYADEQGSASSFSNMVFANLIVLPEGLVESYEAKERAEIQKSQVPDAEAISYLREGLDDTDMVGGNRLGGSYSDAIRGRSALAEVPTEDGGQEALTHALLVGNSVLGVVRTLNAQRQLKQSRLVLLPIGQQFIAYDAGRDQPVTLMSLDVEKTDHVPRATHGAIQDWDRIKVGRKELTAALGVEDQFASKKHLEVTLTGGEGSLHIEDAHSANGVGVITIDTLLRKGPHGLHGLARESALALLDTLQQQPELWAGKAAA